jgi:acetoacetate decarboxylase
MTAHMRNVLQSTRKSMKAGEPVMTERRWGLVKPTEADIVKGGFSRWDAPFIPPFPPFKFRCEILTVFYRTDPAAAVFLAPPPVTASGDIVAILYR